MAGETIQMGLDVPMYGKGPEQKKSPDDKSPDDVSKKGVEDVRKDPKGLSAEMKSKEPLPASIMEPKNPEGGKMVGGGGAISPEEFDNDDTETSKAGRAEGATAEGNPDSKQAEAEPAVASGTSDGQSSTEGQTPGSQTNEGQLAPSPNKEGESAGGETFKTKEELLQKYPNFDSLLKAAKSGKIDGNNLLDMYKKIAPCSESEARVFNDAFDLIKSGKVASDNQEKYTIFKAERRLNYVYDRIASPKK